MRLLENVLDAGESFIQYFEKDRVQQIYYIIRLGRDTGSLVVANDPARRCEGT